MQHNTTTNLRKGQCTILFCPSERMKNLSCCFPFLYVRKSYLYFMSCSQGWFVSPLHSNRIVHHSWLVWLVLQLHQKALPYIGNKLLTIGHKWVKWKHESNITHVCAWLYEVECCMPCHKPVRQNGWWIDCVWDEWLNCRKYMSFTGLHFISLFCWLFVPGHTIQLNTVWHIHFGPLMCIL